MRYDTECQRCSAQIEVVKPMRASFPKCAECGGPLRHLFRAAPPVHYHSAGFFSTDVLHFQRQVGTERFAKFEAERDASIRRMKSGRPTRYEYAAEVAFGAKNDALFRIG